MAQAGALILWGMSVPFALLLAATAPACAIPAAEQQRQMALPYEMFDSAPAPHGWRTLNSSGCTDAAIALLAAYREANAAKLNPEQRRELPFHIGQTLAFAGRDGAAASYFEQADSPDAPAEWRAYVAAHIAFFRHDRLALEQARANYAAAPTAGPMRLKIIDGLIACPGKAYMVAAYCRM